MRKAKSRRTKRRSLPVVAGPALSGQRTIKSTGWGIPPSKGFPPFVAVPAMGWHALSTFLPA